MFKKHRKDTLTYGIVGLGRFGTALAMELAANGAELLVIDGDEEKVRKLRELTDNAFIVKKLNRESLQETGINDCDVAVVCMAEHMDTSILVTLHLVSMGIPHVISKANSAEHGEILEKLGAEVVYPERDMAIRLASRLETSRVLDIIQLSEKINISKVEASPAMLGKSIIELELRARFGLNIIAIENKGVVAEMIDPKYLLRPDDVMYLCGSKEGFVRLSEWMERA